jgi:glycosyltransferase involved in cell wall biosynthesis
MDWIDQTDQTDQTERTLLMRGEYPYHFMQATRVDKPLEAIYREQNGVTWELLPGDEVEWIDTQVVLPPLELEGVATKGVLWTMAADYLVDRYPELPQLFHILAESQLAGIPWSRMADGLCAVYANPRRNQWFRRTYPDRTGLLLPIQIADFTNERLFAPDHRPKTRDLLCVARQAMFKNLPFLADAVARYNRNYGPLRLTLVAGYGVDWAKPEGQAAAILDEVRERTAGYEQCIELEPYRCREEMPALYNAHRLFVLGSLFEGKNRAIHEAMCCDLPVVCCEAYNQFARGDVPIFPPGAGMYAPFDPEGFARTIHHVVIQPEQFNPRQAYLSGFSGRQYCLEMCLRAFPQYRELMPGYDPVAPADNRWLEEAITDNYRCKLSTFLYEENPCNHAIGLDHHDSLVQFYRSRSSGLLAARGPELRVTS